MVVREESAGRTGPWDTEVSETAESVTAPFNRLVEEHYAEVLRNVVLSGAPIEDARDAVQQAFLETWERLLARGAWEIERPRAWLTTVAMRKYFRPPGTRRKPAVDPMPELPEPRPQDLDPSAFPALTISVMRAAERVLDRRQWRIVLLAAEGATIPEIHEALGGVDTPAAVQRTRDELKKARKLLWRELRDQGEE